MKDLDIIYTLSFKKGQKKWQIMISILLDSMNQDLMTMLSADSLWNK